MDSCATLPFRIASYEWSNVCLEKDENEKNRDICSCELDNENWNYWTNNFIETRVYLQLPKFKFETFKLLNDPLSSLGMGIAFTDAADFTRINRAGNLFISRVLHKTFIDVNEEGTEAAAVTAVEISLTSAGGSGLTHFIADKPFLFVIRENATGSLLFMGRLSQPDY